MPQPPVLLPIGLLLGGFAAVAAAQVATVQEDDPTNLLAKADPVVEAILASPRTEPADFIRTAFVLLDLNEIESADVLLAELVGMGLDDGSLAGLVGEFGSAKFLRVAVEERFRPETRDFAKRAVAAAGTQARDPGRLAEIVRRLGSDNARERTAAIVDLRTTGSAG
ncbi:MAG: hypothetical protein AAF596_10510, partial [Planctomycetota bacterium]